MEQQSLLKGGGDVVGTPIYNIDHPNAKRFVVNGYKDVWASVLFLINIIATHGVAIYFLATKKSDSGSNNPFTPVPGPTFWTNSPDSGSMEIHIDGTVYGVLIGASALSAVVALVVVYMMKLFPMAFIYFFNILQIALSIAATIGLWIWTKQAGVLVFLMWPALHTVWFLCIRKFIPFSSLLLKTATEVVFRHYGTLVTSVVSLVPLCYYFVWWFIMVYFAFRNDGSFPLACLFFVLGVWVSQVITNVVHVTTCGTVATWYFVGAQYMPPNPSVSSLKRAMTTSFGSICFGSLVIAILKLLHAICRSMSRQNNLAACIARIFLAIIERLMEYFNVYAFTYVAIYGSSYIEAAKQTWNLILNQLYAPVFNDSLIFPVLELVGLLDSILLAIAAGFAAHTFIVGFIVFYIAYVIHALILRVIYSGVVTILVCFCENPDALYLSNPEFQPKIQEAAELAKQSCCGNRQ